MIDKEWKAYIKDILKDELRKRKVTYPMLVEKLNDLSVKESLFSIKNKISRGTFNTVFFVQCLKAIGCKSVKLDKED